MSIRTTSMCFFVLAMMAAVPAAAEIVVITLDGVGEKVCDEVWTDAGLDMYFTETTAEDCDGGGACYFDTDVTEVWLYPSRLVADLGSSRPVTRVEVDVIDWCGAGCTRAFVYDQGASVAQVQNTVGGGGTETLIMVPSGGTADAVAVSSCEGQASEIRITFGDEPPGGCTATADCGSFELCIDGECVETFPCEVDSECDAGWACTDGFCQPGEPVGCVSDSECAEGFICLDGVCIEESGGPECDADAECGEGEYCVAGACFVAVVDECEADDDCGGGWECVEGECAPGAGPECSADTDCAAGEACVYGECLGGCTADAECDAGSVCVDGACVDQGDTAECTVDADCAEGEICTNGACLAGCTADADCGEGMACMNTACVKAAEPDCVAEADCGPGFECAAGACVPTGDGPGDDGEGSDDGGGRGCSVNDSAAPPSGLWLLLLGVVLVVRRTHWQGTR